MALFFSSVSMVEKLRLCSASEEEAPEEETRFFLGEVWLKS